MTISNNTTRATVTASGLSSFGYGWRILDESDLTVILRTLAGVETTQVLNTDYTVTGTGDVDGGTVEFLSTPTATDSVTIFLDPDRTQTLDLSAASDFPPDAFEDALDKLTNQNKRTRDIASRSLFLTDGSTPGSGEYDADGQRIINLADPTADQDAATQASVNAAVLAAVLDPTTPVGAFGATLVDDATQADALVTLGGGTKGIAIFKDTSNAAVLTELGVTALGQSLLADATTTAARATLEIPQTLPKPNYLLNGDFQVWQRGQNFTAAAPVAGGNNDDSYFADQWYLLSNGADVVDVTPSASTFGFPAGCRGLCEFEIVTANTNWAFVQPMESKHTICLQGKEVTISFWAAANSDALSYRCHLVSWTSAADSLTSDIISAWVGTTSAPTTIASADLTTASASGTAPGTIGGGFLASGFTLVNDSAWRQFYFTFTVPAGAQNMGVYLGSRDSSMSSTAKVGFSGFQLTEGAYVGPYVSRSFADELRDCQRFYCKTGHADTFMTDNIGVPGALASLSRAHGGGTDYVVAQWGFPVEMLTTPTVTGYNPTAGTAARWDVAAGGTPLAYSVIGTGTRGCTVRTTADAGDNIQYFIHADADARL